MLSALRSWDPLYGRIEFSEFEYGLLKLPEVQRLRYVRMCNINSLLVTGASEISRFEHTIGVLNLAKVWCSVNGVTGRQAREISAAAVLHDMQTGPFGHSMQYVLEDNQMEGSFVHEDLSHGWKSTYHQEILAGATFAGRPFSAPSYLGDSWEAVARIIRGEGKFGPLIAGTMDLDNIDNVVRLAFHVGVAEKADAQVALDLASQMRPVERGISLPRSAVPVVERWQAIRRRLYDLLLLDWAEFSAKAMLTRAIERAAEHELIGADSWIRTDSEFLDYLDRKGIGDAQEVKDLVRRLRGGDLYTPIALLASPSIEAYASVSEITSKQKIEAAVLRSANVKGVKILSHFILDKGKTERSISFVDEFGSANTVGQNTRRLLCGVFAASSLSESDRSSIAKAFVDALHEGGVADLEAIVDPMGAIQPLQQQLI